MAINNYWVYPGLKKNFIATSDSILNAVCEYNHITLEQIKGKEQFRKLVDFRSIYYFLCKKYTTLTLRQMGVSVNRNHATVISGLNNANSLILYNEEFFHILLEVESFLLNQLPSATNER